MTVQQLATMAAPIIFAQEGNYSSVNANDNGALSIGKIQWHASRALSLMRSIVKEDVRSQEIIGSSLYSEIVNPASTWNNRVMSKEEAQKLSSLLDRPISRTLQDSLAISDISNYIQVALKMGLLDNQALIYFADIYNQGPKLAKDSLNSAASECGDVKNVSLDRLYNHSLKYFSKYINRRNTVYSKCKLLAVTYTVKDGEFYSKPNINVSASVTVKPEQTTSRFPNLSSYKGSSIVDGLKSVGYDASFKSRGSLYSALKLPGTYTGSAEQNVALLNALR